MRLEGCLGLKRSRIESGQGIMIPTELRMMSKQINHVYARRNRSEAPFSKGVKATERGREKSEKMELL